MTLPNHTTGDEDGFSILEMIVAMTILALVLGIASQSVVLASRNIAAAKVQVETARAIRELLADYEADIGSQRPELSEQKDIGWSLEARKIEASKAKITAIIIKKNGGAGGGAAPFLTFIPQSDVGSQ